MSERNERVERAVEILVLAPVGAGLLAIDAAPEVITTCAARARAEIDRRQEELNRHIVSVRSTGEVALAFGLPRVRRRLDSRIADARKRVDEILGRGKGIATRPAPAPTPARSVPEPNPSDETPTAPAVVFSYPPRSVDDGAARDALPIPGYDALSASQVVERLTGLGRDELDAVHAYESAHRGRRTILGKIEQHSG
jgi:hypothetical protein